MTAWVRKAVPSDAEDIFLIENASFSLPRPLDAIERELRNEELARYMVVTDEKGDVIGYAELWLVLDEGEIINIALSEEHRGQGYGEQLLRALMEAAWKDGCSAVFLEVRASNTAAAALYRKVGYEVISVRKQYYDAPAEDAYVMECKQEQYRWIANSAKG